MEEAAYENCSKKRKQDFSRERNMPFKKLIRFMPGTVYEYYEETEALRRLKPDFFKRFLELPNGIPDESVFRRVLQCINLYHLKEVPENRLAGIRARTKEGGG
jgi:hypothetical protein